MRILILNWRDPKNPKAGGAEKLNMHILEPFISRGDEVVWYAMGEKGLAKEEKFKGIQIVRFGNLLTHFLFWPLFFFSGKFGKIDFLIDSIHGIGYFSIIFAPHTKKRILVCEVAKNIWDEMIPFPGNFIGKMIEPLMFRFYAKSKLWTISQSTKKDLEKMKIDKRHILVLPMGFDAPKVATKFDKVKSPTALFVGRLAEMKGIKDALFAINETNRTSKNKWRLTIIGKGGEAYEEELHKIVKNLNISDSVKFLGFVPEEKKFETMAKAWVLLVPSSREGWGMIVPEANFVGTPVIAYTSPGLVDSVTLYAKENRLVANNYHALAKELNKLDHPQQLKNKIDPGWDALKKTVLKDII